MITDSKKVKKYRKLRVMYYLLGIMLTGFADAGLMMRKRRKML